MSKICAFWTTLDFDRIYLEIINIIAIFRVVRYIIITSCKLSTECASERIVKIGQ